MSEVVASAWGVVVLSFQSFVLGSFLVGVLCGVFVMLPWGGGCVFSLR